MIIYGISTCDTCRKARKALEAAGREVHLRDVRQEPLSQEEIARFIDAFGQRLINRASTTWRGLDDEARQAEAAVLLARHPTLMKRPVIAAGHELTLGWGKDVQAVLLS